MRDERPAAPRKQWGQHFLRDPRAAERIVEALGPAAGERILEIGPGRGALTERLLRHGPVVAVEIDPRCAAGLRDRFAGRPLTVLEGDILAVSFEAIADRAGCGPRERIVVAGNLPYNISKPIASKLIRERRRIARAVLMFQREVADRLTAVPATRAYGPLSVLAGEAYRIDRLFDLRPHAFDPPPEVVSSVTRWIARADADFPAADEAPLRRALAACFAMRRKTLFNNLRARLGEPAAARLLREAGIEGTARAERIDPEAYRRLARLWPEPPPGGNAANDGDRSPDLD